MISRASSICGMGDALNQRAFLVAYCKEKNIPPSQISVYTEKYWWAFEGLGFKRGLVRSDFGGLVAYRNFGFYDMPRLYEYSELDVNIAQNAGIKYSFEVCVPFPKFKKPRIKLPQRFITFNTGFGNLSGKPGNSAYICLKSWPSAYWAEFVRNIGVPCVQIGGGPSCEIIPGTALNLVDKLTIQESAEVMRRALFHVDMEGGLPILAQHLGKRSVVLFGPTAIENQGRSFNLNIRQSTCTPCYEWGYNSRKRLYAMRYELPCGVQCMRDIKPAHVVAEIQKAGWLAFPNGVPPIDKKFIIDWHKTIDK